MSEENDVVVDNSAAENEAKQFGWKPLEEYQGNPDEWKDAETFLKRGKEINGFLRKDLEKIQKTLQHKDAELAEIRETMEEFRKYHNETEARAYARAVQELKQEKITAIQQGDGERVVEIDEQIDQLKEAQTSAPKAPAKEEKKTQETYDAEYVTWAKENLWFNTDPELQQLALLVGQEINAQSPDVKGSAFYNEVTKRVKESMPEKFTNQNRSTAAVGTSSDGRTPGTKKKKGYNDLPPEAKSACDKFVKQGLMTQEKYITEYQWD
jgi:DNA-binding transcriptional MerR regulator